MTNPKEISISAPEKIESFLETLEEMEGEYLQLASTLRALAGAGSPITNSAITDIIDDLPIASKTEFENTVMGGFAKFADPTEPSISGPVNVQHFLTELEEVGGDLRNCADAIRSEAEQQAEITWGMVSDYVSGLDQQNIHTFLLRDNIAKRFSQHILADLEVTSKDERRQYEHTEIMQENLQQLLSDLDIVAPDIAKRIRHNFKTMETPEYEQYTSLQGIEIASDIIGMDNNAPPNLNEQEKQATHLVKKMVNKIHSRSIETLNQEQIAALVSLLDVSAVVAYKMGASNPPDVMAAIKAHDWSAEGDTMTVQAFKDKIDDIAQTLRDSIIELDDLGMPIYDDLQMQSIKEQEDAAWDLLKVATSPPERQVAQADGADTTDTPPTPEATDEQPTTEPPPPANEPPDEPTTPKLNLIDSIEPSAALHPELEIPSDKHEDLIDELSEINPSFSSMLDVANPTGNLTGADFEEISDMLSSDELKEARAIFEKYAPPIDKDPTGGKAGPP